jgi:hypothetical protein
MEQADCPLNVCLILSDPLVSKDNKGKSTMTTSNRRISQKIDNIKVVIFMVCVNLVPDKTSPIYIEAM